MITSITFLKTAFNDEIRYSRDFGPIITLEDIPPEILTNIESIVNFLEGMKTPEQMAIEDKTIALDFIKTVATPAQKGKLANIFPKWIPGKSLKLGDEVSYKGKVYKVLIDLVANKIISPDISPTYYEPISK